jgi:hypothetical protein
MLTWLARGLTGLTLLNVTAIIVLCVAYAWQHWLKPARNHREIRQRGFERLLSRLTPHSVPRVSERRDPEAAERSASLEVPYP